MFPLKNLARRELIFAHLYVFTSRTSINKMRKIPGRTLRFGLKNLISDCESLLTKSSICSLKIPSMRYTKTEMYSTRNGMGPG